MIKLSQSGFMQSVDPVVKMVKVIFCRYWQSFSPNYGLLPMDHSTLSVKTSAWEADPSQSATVYL